MQIQFMVLGGAVGLVALLCAPPADAAEAGLGAPVEAASANHGVAVSKSDTASKRRFEWNLETTLGDYERIGRKQPAWDPAAREALTAFSQMRARWGDQEASGANFDKSIKAAIAAECNDPLIRYLNLRLTAGSTARATKETAEAYVQAAQDLEASEYAPVRKFFGWLRAAEAIKAAYSSSTNLPPKVHGCRRAAFAQLQRLLNQKDAPFAEVREATTELMTEVESNKKQLEEFYFALEKPLLANWPNEAGTHLIQGRFYIKYAWKARGSDVASRVTAEGWKLFEERLAIAERELEKAWSIDPSDEQVALNMMTVELGQGKGRDRLETWFLRAMRINTNGYVACSHKLYYLEPKWHGTPEEMLRFGRQCLESKEWGGEVPLILADAHHSLANYFEGDQAKAYWKRPGVWEDCKASYEEFLKRNPDAAYVRKYYARAAYRCEQWSEAVKQLGYVRPVDHAFFGGTEAFNRILKTATEKAPTPPK